MCRSSAGDAYLSWRVVVTTKSFRLLASTHTHTQLFFFLKTLTIWPEQIVVALVCSWDGYSLTVSSVHIMATYRQLSILLSVSFWNRDSLDSDINWSLKLVRGVARMFFHVGMFHPVASWSSTCNIEMLNGRDYCFTGLQFKEGFR